MKKILLYFIIISFTLSGCRDWLDINRDPNNAEIDKVSLDILLPASQVRIAALLNNSSDQTFLAHHLTKSGSVGGTYNFLTGRIQPQNTNTFWEELYTVNASLTLIKDKAIEYDVKSYEGIARTLMVHNYQRLVDMFGNIPYSEAMQGKDKYQPKYDDAKTVYDNLLTDIDDAIACLTAAKSADQAELSRVNRLQAVDVMASGNMDKWIRFANSLKLRLLMRISDVDNSARTQIAAIADKCLGWNEIMDCNPGYRKENAKMRPWSISFGWNHLDQERDGHTFYRPTRDFIDMLRENNDPRLRVYAQPRLTLTDDPDGYADYATPGLATEPYIGVPYGQQNPPENPYTSSIGIGTLFLSTTLDPTASSPIMGGFEVYFFLAEAALEGYIPGGDAVAKSHYEDGVKGVFKYYEVPLRGDIEMPGYPESYSGMLAPVTGTAEAAAADYLSQVGNTFCNWGAMTTKDQKLAAIASQKWISLFGVNPVEAWSEHRRLDLPELGSSRQAQYLYNISILPYPQTEINLNYDNFKPHGDGRSVTEDLLFWDRVNPLAPRVAEYLD